MTDISRIFVVGAGLVAALQLGGAARAADQGITAKKLLLKGGAEKIVLISKDDGIDIGGSDPVGGNDSFISFDGGSGPVTFNLPKTLWSTNGSATLFKYKNDSAPGGPSVVKIAKIKPGLLKVVAKGLPFTVPNGAAAIDVVLSLDGGTNTYCMTFNGTGDGSKFLVKDASAGSCAVCPNNEREGTEECDGTDDAACPGNCFPDCSCAGCGNNVVEGTEVCDGTDDTACPNDCRTDCTCHPPCPLDGSALACNQWSLSDECNACSGIVPGVNTACGPANVVFLCSDGELNDICSVVITGAGCAIECCPTN